jgi:response regulator RpfG family c-di-GMP phosphodiesterase
MPGAKTVTILSIDDEPFNNELLSRACRSREDYRLLIADSAQRGLEILKTEEVDVLLVDQSMPTMSGVEFVEHALRMLPRAICLMVTGYPELNEVLDASDRGLVHHIVAKPWRPKELMRTIDVALTLKDLRQLPSKLAERQH